MQQIKYEHKVNLEYFLWETNYSISKIASLLGFLRNTIIREIKINSTAEGYFVIEADKKCLNRILWTKNFRMIENKDKHLEFSKKFKEKYDGVMLTIELTWIYIKNNFDKKMLCIKTVYNWINSNKWIITKKDLLRPNYKKYLKRTGTVVERLVGKRRVAPF